VEIRATGDKNNQAPQKPFKIATGLKTNLGVYVMNIPCCLSVLLSTEG